MRFLLAITQAETRILVQNLLTLAFPDSYFCELQRTQEVALAANDVAFIDDGPSLASCTKLLGDLSEIHPNQPVIAITQDGEADSAIRLLKAGAADVVFLQEAKERLVPSIQESLQRSRTSERLQRRKRLESLATLVGGIVHDLNNALAPIRLALDMLPKVKDPKQIQFITTTLRTSVERGAATLRQLQTFSHGEESDRQSLSLKDVVHEVEADVRPRLPASIELKVSPAGGFARVLGDLAQLTRVLKTLIANAVEAMPQGGQLIIETKSVSLLEGDASRGLRSGDYLCLQVADTGVGISESSRDKVLDPFFTTKETGAGLGLATAYGIVRRHGGFLEVTGEPQGGAKASVYLPCQASPPEPFQSGKDIGSASQLTLVET